MAVTYGFYDSINGDRKYSGKQLMEVFDGIISDGVISGYENSLAVTKSGGNVLVGTGRAWFDGTWTFNSAALSFAITTASTINGRCDIVGIQINQNTRTNSFFYRAGTPSSNYQNLDGAPTPVQTGGVYEYILAYVLVPTSGAADATIIDARGTGNPGAAPYASVYGISDDTYVKIDQGIGRANKVIVTDANGKIRESSDVGTAKLNLIKNLSSDAQTQLNNLGLADKGIAPIEVKVSTLTISEAHAGRFLMCKTNNSPDGIGSSITINLPNATNNSLPIGTEILFCRYGWSSDRNVTIVPGSAVSIRAVDGSDGAGINSIKLSYPMSVAGIKKVYSDCWVAFGDYEIV